MWLWIHLFSYQLITGIRFIYTLENELILLTIIGLIGKQS